MYGEKCGTYFQKRRRSDNEIGVNRSVDIDQIVIEFDPDKERSWQDLATPDTVDGTSTHAHASIENTINTGERKTEIKIDGGKNRTPSNTEVGQSKGKSLIQCDSINRHM